MNTLTEDIYNTIVRHTQMRYMDKIREGYSVEEYSDKAKIEYSKIFFEVYDEVKDFIKKK